MSPNGVLSGLDRLRQASLVELNDVAALQSRVDRKYVLTVAEAGALFDRLDLDVRVLEVDGLRCLGYE